MRDGRLHGNAVLEPQDSLFIRITTGHRPVLHLGKKHTQKKEAEAKRCLGLGLRAWDPGTTECCN